MSNVSNVPRTHPSYVLAKGGVAIVCAAMAATLGWAALDRSPSAAACGDTPEAGNLARSHDPEDTRHTPMNRITVGPASAEVIGTTNRAIQIAIDALHARGGGEVRLLPGEYICHDAVRLRPNVRLIGRRGQTILRRAPLVSSPLAVDADKSQREITPEDATGFAAGMGVCLYDRQRGWLQASMPLTITAVRDGVLYLDDYLKADRLAEQGGRVVNYFPLLLAVEADKCAVDGLTVDGAVDDPDGALAGLRAATVYIWRSRSVSIRNLDVLNAPGDGICFSSSSEDGVIDNCLAAGSGLFGIHVGSHSTRATVTNCEIRDSAYDGLYICWGIRHSTFTDNHIWRNGWAQLRSGISIGHKDTDNLIARNHIHDNAKFGICFRRKTPANSPHRVTVRDNLIENNGSQPEQLREIKDRLPAQESIGCGIHVYAHTTGLVVEGNTIRETRQGDRRTQIHAVVLDEDVSEARVLGNDFSGHPGRPVVNRGRDNHIED